MAKAKRSTSGENVSAAYDRLIQSGNQIGTDTKAMYQRILDLEGEYEDYKDEAQTKLNEIVKEYDREVNKLTSQRDNLQAIVDRYTSVFGEVTKTIGSIKA